MTLSVLLEPLSEVVVDCIVVDAAGRLEGAPLDAGARRTCGPDMDCEAVSWPSPVRPRLRFKRLLAMPEVKFVQRPDTLWPTRAPIPVIPAPGAPKIPFLM